jgi:hypothetical protein
VTTSASTVTSGREEFFGERMTDVEIAIATI